MAKLLAGDVKDADFKTVEGESEDMSELQDSLDHEIREALSTLNADPNDQTIFFKVLKLVKGSKKPWECFIANMAELDEIGDRIRREYGSGWYKVNIIRNGKLFKIIDYPILAPEPQTNAAQPAGDLASILNAMAQNQQRQFDQLKEVLLQGSGRAAVPSDPFDLMKSMATAMVSMKDIMQPAVSVSPLSNLKELAEVLDVLRGDGGSGKDTNFMDVIATALKSPVLEGILTGAVANAAKPQNQLPAPHAPQPSEADMNLQQKLQMKAYLDMLVGKASRGGNPELAAENILEDIPENLIREHLIQPGALDQIAAVNGGVNTYRPWFERLQQSLIKFMSEQQGIDEHPAA